MWPWRSWASRSRWDGRLSQWVVSGAWDRFFWLTKLIKLRNVQQKGKQMLGRSTNREIDASIGCFVVGNSVSVFRGTLRIGGFSWEVMNAMKFVFGPYMVCDTPETAKQITFHPNVRVKTVTKVGGSKVSGFLEFSCCFLGFSWCF